MAITGRYFVVPELVHVPTGNPSGHKSQCHVEFVYSQTQGNSISLEPSPLSTATGTTPEGAWTQLRGLLSAFLPLLEITQL